MSTEEISDYASAAAEYSRLRKTGMSVEEAVVSLYQRSGSGVFVIRVLVDVEKMPPHVAAKVFTKSAGLESQE